jgi:hypothetical protein
MIKIIVYISGGVVQNAISNSEGVEMMIVDYDNEDSSDTRDRSFIPVKYDDDYFERTVKGVEN